MVHKVFKRINIGAASITLLRVHAEAIYTREEALMMDYLGNRIVKQSTEHPNSIQVRYAYKNSEAQVLGYIRGIPRSNGAFYIDKIRNDSITGAQFFMPQIFKYLQQDLRSSGYSRLYTVALPRLVPLAKRYGFQRVKDTKLDELLEKTGVMTFIRKLPIYCVELEKRL